MVIVGIEAVSPERISAPYRRARGPGNRERRNKHKNKEFVPEAKKKKTGGPEKTASASCSGRASFLPKTWRWMRCAGEAEAQAGAEER